MTDIEQFGIINITEFGGLSPSLLKDSLNAVKEIEKEIDIEAMSKRAHTAKKEYNGR